MTLLLLALAGGLGAVLRLVVDSAVRTRVGTRSPWGTALVNVTGSFLLGVLTGLTLFHGAPGEVRLVLGTGFCGGYTTFGTASVETVRLLQQGRAPAALINAAGTLAATALAAAAGLVLTGL